MTNLEIAFKYLVEMDEGSKYTNNPLDRGGPTKYGITKKTYESFFGPINDLSEIENMTLETARGIYEAQYWKPLRCGDITDLALSIIFFDCGVLYGVKTTAILIQRALNLRGADIKLDGILGDRSIDSINSYGGGPAARTSLTKTYHGLLLGHIDAVIAANPKDEAFRHGWTLRADRLLQLVLDDRVLNRFKESSA